MDQTKEIRIESFGGRALPTAGVILITGDDLSGKTTTVDYLLSRISKMPKPKSKSHWMAYFFDHRRPDDFTSNHTHMCMDMNQVNKMCEMICRRPTFFNDKTIIIEDYDLHDARAHAHDWFYIIKLIENAEKCGILLILVMRALDPEYHKYIKMLVLCHQDIEKACKTYAGFCMRFGGSNSNDYLKMCMRACISSQAHNSLVLTKTNAFYLNA